MQIRQPAHRLAIALIFAVVSVPASVAAQGTAAPSKKPPAPARTPDVIFVPTPREVVDQMLAVAHVGKNDVVYDLGSGDGRIVITAADRLGARGIGIDLPLLTVLLIVAAILGDAVNYWIGYKLGPAVFNREDSRLLNKKHLLRAQEFYEKYGGKTIILARFVPIVRTFAPIVAGVSRMNYRTFVRFNVLGGLLWGVGVTTLGFLLGEAVDIDKYLLPVIAVIVLLSVLPVAVEILKARRDARSEQTSKSS